MRLHLCLLLVGVCPATAGPWKRPVVSGDSELVWKSPPLGAACVAAPGLSKDREAVYVPDNSGAVTAIHVSNGTVKWTTELNGRVMVQPHTTMFDGTDHSDEDDEENPPPASVYLTSAEEKRLLHDEADNLPGVIVATERGSVFGLLGLDGSERWRWVSPEGDKILARPAMDELRRRLYVASGKMLFAVDMDDGDTLWEYPLNNTVEAAPVLVKDRTRIVLPTSNGDVVCVDVHRDGRPPRPRWLYATGARLDWQSPPAFDAKRKRVFVGGWSKEVAALDSGTGTLLWTHPAGDVVAGLAVGADGAVYVGSSDKHLRALDGATGKAVWDVGLGGAIQATPALAKDDGSLAVGTCSNSLVMLANDGSELWRHPTDGWVVGNAVRGPNCDVFFCSLDKHAYRVGKCHKGHAGAEL